jgi:hypothetical protein
MSKANEATASDSPVLDLQAIKRRRCACIEAYDSGRVVNVIECDMPVLITEIERLRALHASTEPLREQIGNYVDRLCGRSDPKSSQIAQDLIAILNASDKVHASTEVGKNEKEVDLVGRSIRGADRRFTGSAGDQSDSANDSGCLVSDGVLRELFDFIGVNNLKDAKQSVTGLRERIIFTRDFESIRDRSQATDGALRQVVERMKRLRRYLVGGSLAGDTDNEEMMRAKDVQKIQDQLSALLALPLGGERKTYNTSRLDTNTSNVLCCLLEVREMADHKGFASEQEARERAVADMPNKQVYIIESRGQFYVETEDDSYGGFLRSWERECYHGLGREALKPNGKRWVVRS